MKLGFFLVKITCLLACCQALDDRNQTMSVPRGAVHAKWIIGKVIGTKMQKTAKVRVTRLVLDPYLLKVKAG